MNMIRGISMLRTSVCLAAMLFVSGTLVTASAQTAAPPPQPKVSKMRLTVERLKEMRAKWNQNKPRLAACRKEVKSRGLAGDDRWFYIEDCMGKT
jgi:hypothetical protein